MYANNLFKETQNDYYSMYVYKYNNTYEYDSYLISAKYFRVTVRSPYIKYTHMATSFYR